MNTFSTHRWAVLGALLLATACTTTGKPAASVPSAATIAEENDAIRPVVEKLAVNVRELRVVYDDLHILARGAISGADPDRQLDYVQKVYLYVNAALLVAEYQYKMLSVLNYVKDARRTDYLTLRARGLDEAISRMKETIIFMTLYDAFIINPKVTATIARTQALIQGNIYLYDQLLDILQPLVHPAGAFTLDPYAPI
ncbi:MAG: hypothetical protein ABIL58_04185 [Pseudomonadota bacterium]